MHTRAQTCVGICTRMACLRRASAMPLGAPIPATPKSDKVTRPAEDQLMARLTIDGIVRDGPPDERLDSGVELRVVRPRRGRVSPATR